MISDAKGLPLLVHTTAANVRDEKPAEEMVKALPAVKGPRGRPRKKPRELLGDRGYGFAWVIAAIVAMRIISRLCPRGSQHRSGLGSRRWVIERTMSWFGNYRRLKLCYEKNGTSWQAMHELAACHICGKRLPHHPRFLDSFLAES